VSLLLDAGALVAIERGDRDLIALIKGERGEERALVTHAGVVGQVWRGGHGRQANLARILPGVEVVALDDDLGRRAGVLLGQAETHDVIDASVVLLARDGDDIYTSDPDDLRCLVEATGAHIELIPV